MTLILPRRTLLKVVGLVAVAPALTAGVQNRTPEVAETWPPSAWAWPPSACISCGRPPGEYATVVVGGWACDDRAPRDCADRLPKPPRVDGRAVNLPPDWPLVEIPTGKGCGHCGRGGLGFEWPAKGEFVCGPSGAGCWCDDVDCCGEPGPDEA